VLRSGNERLSVVFTKIKKRAEERYIKISAIKIFLKTGIAVSLPLEKCIFFT